MLQNVTTMPDELQFAETLEPRMIKFVEAYCGVSNANATDAARKAGYKVPHRSGWDLMQRDDVKLAIKQRFSASAMGTEELLKLLGAEARGIGEYVEVQDVPIIDTEGQPVIIDGKVLTQERVGVNIKRMKRDKRAGLIKKISNGPNGQTIEFVDPIAAQTLLVKIHKLGDDGAASVTVDLRVVGFEEALEKAYRCKFVDADGNRCALQAGHGGDHEAEKPD